MSLSVVGNNKYRIIRALGNGSFSVVYLATDDEEGQYAIKRTKLYGQNLPREVQILARIQDIEQCVKLIDIFITIKPNVLNIVMKYSEHSLLDLITYYVNQQQLIDENMIKWIMKEILKGLKQLHSRRIVHRDLKPQNILIDNQFKPTEVVIADFGSAKLLNYGERNDPHKISLGYRPPELFFCRQNYSCEVDIWSVGCILLDLYIGQPLFISQEYKEMESFRKMVSYLGPPPQNIIQSYEGIWSARDFQRLISQIDLQDLVVQRDGVRLEYVEQLAKEILNWDPQARPSAKQLLKSSLFV